MECIEERLESHQNVETAYERTKEILKKYPDIKGIFCTTSLDPPGAMKAIKEMGLQGKVFATGTCTMHTGEEYIKDGSLESITFWDPGLTAKVMCNLAVEILENGKESVKDGMDLGYEGYKSMKLEGDVLYGDALVKGTKIISTNTRSKRYTRGEGGNPSPQSNLSRRGKDHARSYFKTERDQQSIFRCAGTG